MKSAYWFAFFLLISLPAALVAKPRVLVVSPEYCGISQTGGLAHATTGLVEALRRANVPTEVILPTCGATDRAAYAPAESTEEELYKFTDQVLRHISDHSYDLVLLSDWTTGLIALKLRMLEASGQSVPKVIYGIHNLSYDRLLSADGATQDLSFAQVGIQSADYVYAPSGKYIEEIMAMRFGELLSDKVKGKFDQGKFVALRNGVTTEEWSPATATAFAPHTFTAENMDGKRIGKSHLQTELGFKADPSVPLFVMTSRLAEQKGYEYLPQAIETALQQFSGQWVVTGDGEAKYVALMQEMQERYPDRFRYFPFSTDFEKRLIRYSDFFINAAWFEPSGQNQMFAMVNGTIPIVSRVGGLAETVNAETGFLVDLPEGVDSAYDKDLAAIQFLNAFSEATQLFKKPQALAEKRRAAMAMDYSWDRRVIEDFLPFFTRVLADEEKTSSVFECVSLLK